MPDYVLPSDPSILEYVIINIPNNSYGVIGMDIYTRHFVHAP